MISEYTEQVPGQSRLHINPFSSKKVKLENKKLLEPDMVGLVSTPSVREETYLCKFQH